MYSAAALSNGRTKGSIRPGGGVTDQAPCPPPDLLGRRIGMANAKPRLLEVPGLLDHSGQHPELGLRGESGDGVVVRLLRVHV
jgi:hypothetical protein